MNSVLERVYEIGIIPVIAFNSVDEAIPLCKALMDGGLPAAEVTFRTACAEECIKKIHEELPNMLLGAGTVLTIDQVDRAIGAGAKFIVSPGFNPEVVGYCVKNGYPIFPGCPTTSDIEAAMSFGLKVVKLGENGITEKDILVHDAHCEDDTLQLKLALMDGPDFPIALGVIRDVAAPTYEAAVNEQIQTVGAKKPYHNFNELLMTNDTWVVE